MSKYNFLTYDFLNEQYHKLGKSLGQIAKENNISKGNLSYIFKKVGMKTRTVAEANKKHFGKEFISKKELNNLYIIKKMSILDIAKKFNVSTSVVFKKLNQFGIETKKRGKCYKVWNKGLTTETSPKLAEIIRKGALKKKGQIPWNKGLPMSEEQKKKLSDNHWSKKPGYVSPSLGKKASKETRRKQSLAKGGTGIPYEKAKHPAEFTDELKEKIRDIFGRKCFLCGLTEETHLNKYNSRLLVHHQDRNVKNNTILNLIALCTACHTSVHNTLRRLEEKI